MVPVTKKDPRIFWGGFAEDLKKAVGGFPESRGKFGKKKGRGCRP